jgi:hypothetical protein
MFSFYCLKGLANIFPGKSLPVAVTIGVPALSVYLSAYEGMSTLTPTLPYLLFGGLRSYCAGAKAFLSRSTQYEDGSLMKQLPIFFAAGMTAEG